MAFNTASVRPSLPSMTTGLRWCALPRKKERCLGDNDMDLKPRGNCLESRRYHALEVIPTGNLQGLAMALKDHLKHGVKLVRVHWPMPYFRNIRLISDSSALKTRHVTIGI